MTNRGHNSAYERTFLGIAITVTALWAVATLIQVVFPAHVVPETLNIVMGTVATAFFGGALVSGRRRGRYYEPPRRAVRPRAKVTPQPEED